MQENAIVLLSGGLDSTVALAFAINEGKNCLALSFNYGQKHQIELEAAKKIAAHYQIDQRTVFIDPSIFKGSALIGGQCIAKDRTPDEISNGNIPNTYVPARNALFLAYAASLAEMHDAGSIYVGFNLMDASGYPDCRPAFLSAFQNLLNVATKQATEKGAPKIKAPLIDLDKSRIVLAGLNLKAPIELSWSCYDPNDKNLPCQRCDACILRKEGFLKNT